MGEAVGRQREQSVDGVVVIAPHASAVEGLRSLAFDLPVVAVEGGDGGGVPVVAVDQRTGAARATQHLLSLDHQTVWHIAGPREWLEARAREAAWRATLVQAGRTPPPVLVGDWSARTGYQHGRTLASRDDATAIFVANDQMALGVLRAVNQARLDVPGDISVVGFDDVPEAAYFVPPLTTVRQDFGAVGRHSLEVLLQQVEGGSPRTDPVVIAPDLVLRESTGRPGPAERDPVGRVAASLC